MTGSGSRPSGPGPRARLGAWERALRLIDYRARTRMELERKLEALGFPEGEIRATLDRLEERGLVDDGEYARSWAQTAARCKHLGPSRIEAMLRGRGIDRDLARRAAADAFAEIGELERARDAALKRIGKGDDVGEAAARRRIAGYLLRRGFSREVAMAVLRSLRAS